MTSIKGKLIRASANNYLTIVPYHVFVALKLNFWHKFITWEVLTSNLFKILNGITYDPCSFDHLKEKEKFRVRLGRRHIHIQMQMRIRIQESFSISRFLGTLQVQEWKYITYLHITPTNLQSITIEQKGSRKGGAGAEICSVLRAKLSKRTTPGIPTWSPTVVLTWPDSA